MVRRSTKRQLAEREVDSYLTPVHELNAESARFRCILMWLQGHDSARRAAAKRAKAKNVKSNPSGIPPVRLSWEGDNQT